MSEEPPASGTRGTGQHVKTSASETFELQDRRQDKRIISADKVGDNLEHCQFETVGVCTLSDKTKNNLMREMKKPMHTN